MVVGLEISYHALSRIVPNVKNILNKILTAHSKETVVPRNNPLTRKNVP